ncbi:fibronectin type III domain-containing protein [Rasiella sp. SM2506]|uniref:fibronectin type III domain-containing protein n=1 Tax=Rasiella sp. SM2506 TaxID=3423914 RepID=UPI003D798197
MKLKYYAIIIMAIFGACSSDDENNCGGPQSVRIAEIDENFVFLTWDSQGAATTVVLGRKGFSPETGTTSVSFDGWTSFGNLAPNGEYETYLQSVCRDNTISDLTGPYGFRTLAFGQGCTQPQSLIINEMTESTVTISWDGMGQNLWEIAYGRNIFNPSESSWQNSNSTTFKLTDIEPGVAYDVLVRASCGVYKYSNNAVLTNIVLIEE